MLEQLFLPPGDGVDVRECIAGIYGYRTWLAIGQGNIEFARWSAFLAARHGLDVQEPGRLDSGTAGVFWNLPSTMEVPEEFFPDAIH